MALCQQQGTFDLIPLCKGDNTMSNKIIEKIHEQLHIEEKVLLESDVDAHTDKLWQLRMSNAHIFITSHYPDNVKRKKMLGLIHELQQTSHEALEHKE